MRVSYPFSMEGPFYGVVGQVIVERLRGNDGAPQTNFDISPASRLDGDVLSVV